jgi:hypothetical protein
MSTRTRARVTDTLPALFPDVFPGPTAPNADASAEWSTRPEPLTAETRRQVTELVGSDEFDAWTEALARVGNCATPIRLHGHTESVDTRTGEILASYSSAQEPMGITHVRCGNRRAAECPSCSRLYAADMFHLIRAGVAGGKTVPATVGENPLVFATLTAPSFGTVHGRRERGPCRDWSRGPARCQHGRSTSCPARHVVDDPTLGRPLCTDCYAYTSHVV